MDNVAPNFSKNYYMYMVNIDDLYYMDVNAVVCFVLEKEELELNEAVEAQNHLLEAVNSQRPIVL